MGVEHFEAAMKSPALGLGESSGIKVFTAEELLTTEPPKRKYLIDGLPLGVVGLIVANGGVGKSFFGVDLALSVSSNVAVAGGLYSVHSMGKVFLVSGEDDTDELHRRIYAVGHKKFAFEKDPLSLKTLLKHVGTNIRITDLTTMPEPFMDDHGNTTMTYEQVLEEAKSIKDLRLIVVDPLRRFLLGDENDSQAATRFIVLLERLSKETGATVLAVHHMSKSGGSNKCRGR